MAPPDALPLSPLPAPGAAPVPGGESAQRLASPWHLRLTWLAVAFNILFAGLLASFPARNSDVWLHLAVGRSVARGEVSPAADSGLPPVLWHNPSWLFDLLCYLLYSAFGGGGLVFAKVLIVAGLAVVLLRLSRFARGTYVATFCTALALLAMSTRLLLQPLVVSYLLLALALWFVRPRQTPAAPRPSVLPPWQLLALFVVWANVDSWFVLGLGVIILAWLGDAVDRVTQRTFSLASASSLLLSIVVLAAVCLVNPSHVHAFTPPAELARAFGIGSLNAATTPLRVTSPFERSYYADLGLNPAGLAYFPLLGLGVLSFILNFRYWSWSRFLPWLALAVLSALQARVIPFFAVIAGPVLACNLQEFGSRWKSNSREGDAERAPGSIGFVLAALCLLVVAWPGWLQAPPFEPRRWGIDLPPSLERGALATRQRHEAGRLQAQRRGLHLTAPSVHAFAWFCPEDHGLLDEPLAAEVLGGLDSPERRDDALRRAKVDHVIVYDTDRGRLFAALERLLEQPDQWPLLYLEGDLAVFGWDDPASPARATESPSEGNALDVNRLAFHPTPEMQAPRKRPALEPRARRWWEAFWKPAPRRSIARDEAMLYLLHAEALRRSAPQRRLAAWEGSQLAGLLGAAAGWMGPAPLQDADLRVVLFRPPLPETTTERATLHPLSRVVLQAQQWYALMQDDTPPALLYLAIRAARRALAVDPHDGRAHLILGRSYLRLLHATRERAWGQRVPELVQLRRVQAAAALYRAVALNPTLAQAHLSLGGLYQEMGYFDLALRHLTAFQKLSRKAGESLPDDDRQHSFDERLGQLAELVAERESSYAAEAVRMSIVDRAVLAFEKGLAGKALQQLLDSDVSYFGTKGMIMELELLLRTGRVTDLLERISPEQKSALGAPTYHWLRTQALAAAGDYLPAEEECAQLASAGLETEPLPPRELIALLAGQAVLNEQPSGASVANLPLFVFEQTLLPGRALPSAKRLRQEANSNVFRGLLALEQGDVEEAEVAFRLALALWQDDAAAASGAGMDFKDRPIAEGCLRWLE
jgi:tetratricopeptide (TPR) repeat protein